MSSKNKGQNKGADLVPILFVQPFLTWKILFPSCSGEAISLHHSFTPSLGHFLLDIWDLGGELPYQKIRDARQISGNQASLKTEIKWEHLSSVNYYFFECNVSS